MKPETPCADAARDRLDDYADGLIDPESAERVRRHLESCPGCRQEVEWLRRFERAARASHLSTAEIVERAWGDPRADDPHLRDCPVCREEVDAVRGAIPAESPVGVPLKLWSRSWMAPALAASILAGLGVVLFIERGAPPAHLEGSTPRGLGSEVRDLAPSGEVPRGRGELIFSWTGRPGARYVVAFFAADGRVIDRFEVPGTRLIADPALRAKIEGESEFFWKVDPMGGDASASGSRLTRVSWHP